MWNVFKTLKRCVNDMLRGKLPLQSASAAGFVNTSSELMVTPLVCLSRTRATKRLGMTSASAWSCWMAFEKDPCTRIDLMAICRPSRLVGPSPCAGADRQPVTMDDGWISPPAASVGAVKAVDVRGTSRNLVSIPRRPAERAFSVALLRVARRIISPIRCLRALLGKALLKVDDWRPRFRTISIRSMGCLVRTESSRDYGIIFGGMCDVT